MRETLRDAWDWFASLPHRYHGLIIGIAVWIVWMIVGFWRMVLLAVLMALFYGLGRLWEQEGSFAGIAERLLTLLANRRRPRDGM
ncbi:DUF2273 domain-containing protein [Alicyclobacillus fructus]|uniref:DUF2273 domain-containing protein n=1 Tax=Alicyclobacillus fructus TaxID=2816082 RepID=UPI001A8F6A36|nr:DUF2273 domain-containing protein [Alicyclobacillus fructus]